MTQSERDARLLLECINMIRRQCDHLEGAVRRLTGQPRQLKINELMRLHGWNPADDRQKRALELLLQGYTADQVCRMKRISQRSKLFALVEEMERTLQQSPPPVRPEPGGTIE